MKTKRRKRRKKAKHFGPDPLPPSPGESLSDDLGMGDSEIPGWGTGEIFQYKPPPEEVDPKHISDTGALVSELGNNENNVLAIHNKVKISLSPRSPHKRRSRKLGAIGSERHLSLLPKDDPLKRDVSQLVKRKDDKSLRTLKMIGELLEGTTFRSSFVYHSATPYLRHADDLVQIYRKPSIGQIRLLLHQLLRCKTSFPWETLRSRLDRGIALNAHRVGPYPWVPQSCPLPSELISPRRRENPL